MMKSSADAGEAGILEFLVRETGIILSGQKNEISEETPLASLGFDSLSFVELLIAIEKKFNLKLIEIGLKPDDMKTLGTLARCIHRAG